MSVDNGNLTILIRYVKIIYCGVVEVITGTCSPNIANYYFLALPLINIKPRITVSDVLSHSPFLPN